MGLLLIAFLVVVSCYFLYLLRAFFKVRARFDKHGIPYPKPWPLLGNLGAAILERKSFRETITETYNHSPEAKYVGYFSFFKPVILLRDLDLIKDVTIKSFESFTNHRELVSTDPFFSNNLFNLQEQRWHEARALLSPAFTTHKMKLGFDIMSECARDFVKDLVKMATKEGAEFEMKDATSKFGHDVVASFALGVKVDSMKNPKNELFLANKQSSTFEGVLSLKAVLYQNFALARFIMDTFGIPSFNNNIEGIFTNIIENTIKTRDEEGIIRPDMIQLMMEARGTPKEISMTEITAHAFGMFFAAFDTSTSQISFLAHELAVNPDIQERLQQEIDDVWDKTEGNLTYDVLNNNLPYLDAIVNETSRIYSPSSLTDRICGKRFELPPALPGGKPYTVEPGDVVWIPIGPILNDAQYFEEPDTFKPERFLGKKVTVNQAPYMPFGQGPRMCIGNRFALLEMKVVIAHLVRWCNLSPCSRTNIPMKYSTTSFVLYARGGFWLKVTPRVLSTTL